MVTDSDQVVEDESDLVDAWHHADLVDRLQQSIPASDALVLRVLAARIAARPAECDDPLMTTHDLSSVHE
ncbi:hypothetical protein [Amycolatopsis anabasis]|uniref:hypothetical protein n=1 Tax=Amycolatopsis anabasis TaxID=1840409 RepID=UPI00131BC36B|nr:hypothetical protein [Amycolatopsis anabasis]